MLVVSLVVQGPAAEAGLPAFGELCTARGIAAAAPNADSPAGKDEPAPDRPAGHIKFCPVCTAFAQNGPADLPSLPTLPLQAEVEALQHPAPASLPPAAHGLAPQSRGPPAVA